MTPRSPDVLFDVRPLQGRDSVRGIGTYVRGVLMGLVDGGWASRLALLADDGLPAPPIPGEFPMFAVRRRYHGRFAAYEDSVILGRDLDRIRPRLFHSPWPRVPASAPCPVVVTVHDLIPWVWGGTRMLGERVRYFPARRLMRRADAVIAVSEATATDCHRVARINPNRIHVIPEGVGPAFRPAPRARERVTERWALSAPYMLYVGGLEPRKDPISLRRAWRAVRRATSDVGLVIAGADPPPPRWLSEARLLGRVTDEELADLYSAAACLVFPSRYEGFGLPILEAMACGCPVAAFRNSSLPELAGDAALLVADGDARALGAAVVEILSVPARARSLRKAGLRRARAFSWARTARATARVYESLLE